MKFLILATCVCMAVAAPQQRFPGFNQGAYQPFAKASASVFSAPAAAAQIAAQDVYNVAQVTAHTAQNTYNVAKNTYNTAQEVYNKAAVKTYSAVGSEVNAETLRADADVRQDGFNYNYETSNNIKAEATGELKQIGDTSAIVVRGQYSYTGADGVPVVVTYIADENGYRAESDAIPVGPAIPEAIARSLQYNTAHPEVIIAAKRA
ncbi:insect cuticle protein domain-containing protein [Phthorimaea operculella]|nr:insect cuticle protein domain-containing protein [Phthorimaea operculella]